MKKWKFKNPTDGTTNPPSPPANLIATVISALQINLSWTAVSGLTYRIERCQGVNCSGFAQIATAASGAYSNTGLTPSTSYSYRVRAVDTFGNISDYSTVVTAATPSVPIDTTPPSIPADLIASAVSSSQINLTWTASTDDVGVTGYRIERCQGAGCGTFSQIDTTPGTSYSNIGLTASTSYSYRVRAVDAAGNLSGYSSVATVATQASPGDTIAPSVPQSVAASAISSSQINLTWNPSTDNVGVTGYRVERCQGAGCVNFAQIGTPSSTSYSDTGLNANTLYRYRVRATDAAGNLSGYSVTVTATTPAIVDTTPPSVPSNLAATPVSSNQINLNWNASTDNVGVTGYRLERCQGAACSGFVEIGTPSTTSYSDVGLTASTLYRYRVRARDAAGNLSSYSSIAETTTQASLGTGVQTFVLTSTLTGTLPFTVGLVFAKGEMTSGPALSGTVNYQSVVKRTWNDGSIKHAIVSGRAALIANTPLTISVTNSTAPTGTNLTAASIQAAAPQASVQCGALGTVNLSSLLAAPFRTWISGPEMVECHYTAQIGSDTVLRAWFHVRLFADGRIWVRVICENGYVGVAEANKVYIPTLQIGGSTVYSNSGVALEHYHNQRWCVEGWIGGDPAVTPKHDSAALIASKLVPNYWKKNPSASTLNSLFQTYYPLAAGAHDRQMHGAGFQDAIAILPRWDALYATSTDPRAFRSMLANSSAFNTNPICYRDPSTKLILKPSDWAATQLNAYSIFTYLPPYWDSGTAYVIGNRVNDGNSHYYQAIQNGTNHVVTDAAYWTPVPADSQPKEWEVAHHPSEGYLAYLMTGDYWHFETMMMNASTIYLTSAFGGNGLNRVFFGEERAVGWDMRTLSQVAAIYPTGDAVAAEYQTLLSNNINHWKGVVDTLGASGLGYLYIYPAYGNGLIAPLQQHYWIQGMGSGRDLEPLAVMTNYNAVLAWMYQAPVGICGNSSGYCFIWAAHFNIKVGNVAYPGPADHYASWALVYSNSIAYFAATGDPYTPSDCSANNSLLGRSGADPALGPVSYWAEFMPALAYAVDFGATGAAAAWARLTGATNWSTYETGASAPDTWDGIPEFGIVPRSTSTFPVGWHEVPSTTLAAVAPANNFGGESYPFAGNAHNVIDAWGGGALDTLRNRLLMWGGGHNDYPGNELYAMNLNSATFTRLNDPSIPTNFNGVTCVEALADGKPNSRHTYGGMAYLPAVDRLICVGGALTCQNGGGSTATWAFNCADNTWQNMNPATHPSGSSVTGLSYDPNTGKIFAHDDHGFWSYDYGTNAWTSLGPGYSVGNHWNSVIDPVRKLFLLIGVDAASGGTPGVVKYDIAPGSSYTPIQESTSGGISIVNGAWPGLAYDPISDRIIAWNGGDTVYSLNLDTNVWTAITAYSGGPGSVNATGTHGRFRYSSTSGLFVLVNSGNQNAFTLKLA